MTQEQHSSEGGAFEIPEEPRETSDAAAETSREQALEQARKTVEAAKKDCSKENQAEVKTREVIEALAVLKEGDLGKYDEFLDELKDKRIRIKDLASEVTRQVRLNRKTRSPGGGRQETQADRLVKYALESGAELFHSPMQDAHVTTAREEHYQTMPLRSPDARRWLGRLFHQREERSPNSDAMKTAVETLEGLACFDGEERDVHLRIAHGEGPGGNLESIYLDLGDGGRVAIVTRDGWEVVDWSELDEMPPVRFVRPRGTLPVPAPEADPQGRPLERLRHLERLRRYVNASDDDFVRVVAWLLGCFSQGPYPLLCIGGEQGSGKSFATRCLRNIFDPRKPATRSLPKEERDLMIAADRKVWILALDNVSRLPDWTSDALCRVATGAGYATRKLYENDEETIFDTKRPVILNGIEGPGLLRRDDLADRALPVRLRAFKGAPAPGDAEEAPPSRLNERDLESDFERDRPLILGGLLDAVSMAIRRLPEVQLEDPPRMADFARFVVAAEPALPWAPGLFLRLYAEARSESASQAIENEDVIRVLVEWFEAGGREEWEGSASQLLDELSARAGEELTKRKTWPESVQKLTAIRKRLEPALREAEGIEIAEVRRAKGKRALCVRACASSRGEPTSPTSPPGETAHDPGLSGVTRVARGHVTGEEEHVTPTGEGDEPTGEGDEGPPNPRHPRETRRGKGLRAEGREGDEGDEGFPPSGGEGRDIERAGGAPAVANEEPAAPSERSSPERREGDRDREPPPAPGEDRDRAKRTKPRGREPRGRKPGERFLEDIRDPPKPPPEEGEEPPWEQIGPRKYRL